MTFPMLEPLMELVELCEMQKSPSCDEWVVDFWDMDEKCCDALASVYRKILLIESSDPIMDEVFDQLSKNNVDAAAVFLNDDAFRDKEDLATKTRSDMTEMAAAASFIATESIDLEHIDMPNVPKRSRGMSDQGFDFMAINSGGFQSTKLLNPNDFLYIGSVKHTTKDNKAMCRLAVGSVAAVKTVGNACLHGQIRVLYHRLSEKGKRCPGILLTLIKEHKENHLVVFAVGAFPKRLQGDVAQDLPELLKKNPISKPHPRFRQLSIVDLETLHERVKHASAAIPSGDEEENSIADVVEMAGDDNG